MSQSGDAKTWLNGFIGLDRERFSFNTASKRPSHCLPLHLADCAGLVSKGAFPEMGFTCRQAVMPEPFPRHVSQLATGQLLEAVSVFLNYKQCFLSLFVKRSLPFVYVNILMTANGQKES